MLDTGLLGMVSHPRPDRDVMEWVNNLLQAGAEILVPEITDYEVRRELLRAKKSKGIKRLEDLKRTMGYVPITTEAMLKAAEFWATDRRRRRPTANDEALDGDAILAGQAVTLDTGGDRACHRHTTNVKHLSRFASAEIMATFNNAMPLKHYVKRFIEAAPSLDALRYFRTPSSTHGKTAFPESEAGRDLMKRPGLIPIIW